MNNVIPIHGKQSSPSKLSQLTYILKNLESIQSQDRSHVQTMYMTLTATKDAELNIEEEQFVDRLYNFVYAGCIGTYRPLSTNQ